MIKKQALKYLGYKLPDPQILNLMDQYLEELESYIDFKVYQQRFHYHNNRIDELELDLHSSDLEVYFLDCNEVIVICATLGMKLEKYLRLLEKTNLSKCVIMDALASSYLEYKLDEYELCITEPRTYRFAPGYGDLDLKYNQLFYEALQLNKRIGVTLTPNCLFIPQKTTLGLIGLGHSNLKKSCHSCIKYDDCSLRKDHIQCWKD